MTTIADQIMTASPPVVALRSQPFSIAELDAHPDAGRIWAALEAAVAAARAEGMREAARIADRHYAAGDMGNPGHHILTALEASK